MKPTMAEILALLVRSPATRAQTKSNVPLRKLLLCCRPSSRANESHGLSDGRLDAISSGIISRRDQTTESRWVFESKTTNSTPPPHYVLVSYSTLAGNDSTDYQARIHQELVRSYNTWSWDIQQADIPLRRHVIAIAAANVFAQRMQIDSVSRSNTVTYKVGIDDIDQNTGAHKHLTVSATPTD